MTKRFAHILALLATAALTVGGSCGPAAPESLIATITFETALSQLTKGTPVPIYVVIDADNRPLQAYELDIVVSDETLVALGAAPVPDFDDDGQFFMEPKYNFFDGKIDSVIDLRHGSSEIGYPVRVALFWVWPYATGTATIEIASAVTTAPNGLTHTIYSTPLTLTVVD